ncbi:MAG: hypothetical protein A2V70_00455 [Planctomycetes bacterium RBG_13_63_9]|nr:MAG: hypothetical protein A2V70_00455 [Planctomycetes bacterium RBG_13_63_9]
MLALAVCGVALGQDAPARDRTRPIPLGGPQAPRAQNAYPSLEAAQDAYRAAEAQRRWAISRQLQMLEDLRYRNPWVAAFVPSPADFYGYANRWTPRRAYRDGFDARLTPSPYIPGPIAGYAYDPRRRQPIGHEKIWTGPNSYVYRPYPAPARSSPPASTPASPVAHPTPAASHPQPERIPTPEPIPIREPIPTPPVESGPREF